MKTIFCSLISLLHWLNYYLWKNPSRPQPETKTDVVPNSKHLVKFQDIETKHRTFVANIGLYSDKGPKGNGKFPYLLKCGWGSALSLSFAEHPGRRQRWEDLLWPSHCCWQTWVVQGGGGAVHLDQEICRRELCWGKPWLMCYLSFWSVPKSRNLSTECNASEENDCPEVWSDGQFYFI